MVVSSSILAIKATSSMRHTPNYRFNPEPQFSVNHIAEYLSSTNASQRTRIICAAKFPKKPEVAAYTQIRKPLREALTKPDFGNADLGILVRELDAKSRREKGYKRDEALRCAKAVRSFQGTFNPRSFSQCEIVAAPRELFKKIEGVRVNVALAASVTATMGDTTNAGGIVLLYAFSADRSAIKERLATTAALVLWALESGQMEPLPRLCMAVDLADQKIFKASSSHTRFRSRVEESCKEIRARWQLIEPPSDYDGPDWQ